MMGGTFQAAHLVPSAPLVLVFLLACVLNRPPCVALSRFFFFVGVYKKKIVCFICSVSTDGGKTSRSLSVYVCVLIAPLLPAPTEASRAGWHPHAAVALDARAVRRDPLASHLSVRLPGGERLDGHGSVVF